MCSMPPVMLSKLPAPLARADSRVLSTCPNCCWGAEPQRWRDSFYRPSHTTVGAGTTSCPDLASLTKPHPAFSEDRSSRAPDGSSVSLPCVQGLCLIEARVVIIIIESPSVELDPRATVSHFKATGCLATQEIEASTWPRPGSCLSTKCHCLPQDFKNPQA